jgi:hypothetical protein
MKKLKFVALFLALLPLSSRAQQDNQPYLYIEKTNGEIIPEVISGNYPILSYEQVNNVNYLSIELRPGVSIMEPCSEIKKIFTGMGKPTGIETVNTTAEETNDAVYNLRGVRVGQNTSSTLPKGVYVVKKGSKTIKTVNP